LFVVNKTVALNDQSLLTSLNPNVC